MEVCRHIPEGLSEEEKYENGIYHHYDHASNEIKLRRLFGKVARNENGFIMRAITGQTVLDIGGGYGHFSRQMMDAGYRVVSIDTNRVMIDLAKRLYGIETLPIDVHDNPFEGGSFDTAVIRETAEHIDFEKTAVELRRILRKELIIFQTNLTWAVKGCRRIIGHREFNAGHLEFYTQVLERTGFKIESVQYCDILALPLSGGLLTRQWCPSIHWLEDGVIALDKILCSSARFLHLAPLLCWRYLLRATLR